MRERVGKSDDLEHYARWEGRGEDEKETLCANDTLPAQIGIPDADSDTATTVNQQLVAH